MGEPAPPLVDWDVLSEEVKDHNRSTVRALPELLTLAVVCGGGRITRTEVAGRVRAGRPVIAVARSGGVADELGAASASANWSMQCWLRWASKNRGH